MACRSGTTATVGQGVRQRGCECAEFGDAVRIERQSVQGLSRRSEGEGQCRHQAGR